MPLTVNLKAYAFDSFRSVDSARYTGPNHTLSAKDYIDAKRTLAKPTATYAGQAKAEAKLTRSMTDGVASDILGDGIVAISGSFPVGSSATEQRAFLDDLAAWLATSEAQALFEKQDINQ